MVNVRYRQILTAGVLHEYYMKKYCSDLEFIPTPSTLRTFRKYGMLMKKLPNGFTVLAVDDGALLEIDKETKEQDNDNVLEFIVKNNNPYFYHISNILFNQNIEEKDEDNNPITIKRKFIFSNKESSINENYKLLHKQSFVGTEDLNRDVPYLKEQDFGLLQISLKGVEDENYGIITGDKITHQTYTIHFDCRKAIWRYYIIQRTAGKYTAFQIISKDDKTFKESEGTINAFEKKVVALISEEELEIKERSNLKFRLQFSEDTEEQVSRAKKLNISLPSPEARNIKPADRENKMVHGNMYVYI